MLGRQRKYDFNFLLLFITQVSTRIQATNLPVFQDTTSLPNK